MRPEDLKKQIKELKLKASAQLDQKIHSEIKTALAQPKTTPATKQPIIWRMIMNSKITKLTAAAVTIIAVTLSITILDKSVAPAYAVEQTIEALKNIRIVHMLCRDWDGKKIVDEAKP